MVGIWLIIAVIAFAIWAWLSAARKIRGDRHQRLARAAMAAGDWQQAALFYKRAIITRLDSEAALRQLTTELGRVYASRKLPYDLSQLLECPRVHGILTAGTGNQRKKNELLAKLYQETRTFLNSLPGPALPEE